MKTMDNPQPPYKCLVSVISHGQSELVHWLLHDLQQNLEHVVLHVVVTINIPEQFALNDDYPFTVDVIHNSTPKGFGANHNQAFAKYATAEFDYYCVINPDVRLSMPVFRPLIATLINTAKAGVVAPLVVDADNNIADSARQLPTLWELLLKLFKKNTAPTPRIIPSVIYEPDWVAGMFMLFKRQIYKDIAGFNPRYFLYYEDVDLCCRLWQSGFHVLQNRSVTIEHNAQRASHQHVHYFKHHIKSVMRFYFNFNYLNCCKFHQRRRTKRDLPL